MCYTHNVLYFLEGEYTKVKEKFIPAEMNLVMFIHQDVITASGDVNDNTLPEQNLG